MFGDGSGAALLIILAVIIFLIILPCIRVVPQAEQFVIERLGACHDIWTTGLHLKMPLAESLQLMSLQDSALI